MSDEQIANLARQAYELAMAGDTSMLKFLLRSAMPAGRLIRLEQHAFGIFADEAADVIATALRAVCDGEITPREGADVAAVANEYTNALEKADIIKRLDAIEAKLPNARVR